MSTIRTAPVTGTGTNSLAPNAPTTSTSTAATPMPAELEHTLALLTGHRSVLGYLLLSRTTPISIIRHVGAIFDGEQGRKYARAVGRIVDAVREGLEEVSVEGADTDEVKFMRIRTKRHEIMISPDERYLLAVLHDPAT